MERRRCNMYIQEKGLEGFGFPVALGLNLMADLKSGSRMGR